MRHGSVELPAAEPRGTLIFRCLQTGSAARCRGHPVPAAPSRAAVRGRPCGFSAATGRCPVSKGRVRGPLLRTCEGDGRFARGFPGERSDGPQVGSGSARQAAPVFVSDRKKRNFGPVRGMGASSARSGCSASPVAIVPAVVSGAAARTQPRLRHSLASGTGSEETPAPSLLLFADSLRPERGGALGDVSWVRLPDGAERRAVPLPDRRDGSFRSDANGARPAKKRLARNSAAGSGEGGRVRRLSPCRRRRYAVCMKNFRPFLSGLPRFSYVC